MPLSLTEQLVSWIVTQRKNGFDAAAIATAQYYVTDWLSSALAGRATVPGQMLLDYAAAQPVGDCHVVGSALSVSAETAALLRGDVGLEAFSAEMLADPTLRALLPCVTMALNDEFEARYPLRWLDSLPTQVRVTGMIGR